MSYADRFLDGYLDAWSTNDPDGIRVRRAPVLRDKQQYVRGYLSYLSFDVPLFVVVFAGFALGILLGLVWEWIREIPERHVRMPESSSFPSALAPAVNSAYSM